MHNGNMGNTAGPQKGDPNQSYGSDFTGECEICGKSHDTHPKVKNTVDRPTAETVIKLVKALEDDFTAPKAAKLAGLRQAQALALAEERTAYGKKEAANKILASTSATDDEKDEASKVQKANAGMERTAKAEKKKVKAEADALEAEINKSGVTIGDKPHYMVGAMMCETHPPAPYVACSGERPPGFVRVAKKAGLKPVTQKDVVTKSDYQAKNSQLQGENFDRFSEHWDKLADAAVKKKYKAPDPGVCAAQHLLTTPHAARALTEAWFNPPDNNNVQVKIVRDMENFLTTKKKHYELDWSSVEVHSYVHTGFVPSCITCQALLPYLLCEDQKPCGCGEDDGVEK